MHIGKLIESQGRYNLTIPKEIIKKKGWKRGQELIVILNEKGNSEIRDRI